MLISAHICQLTVAERLVCIRSLFTSPWRPRRRAVFLVACVCSNVRRCFFVTSFLCSFLISVTVVITKEYGQWLWQRVIKLALCLNCWPRTMTVVSRPCTADHVLWRQIGLFVFMLHCSQVWLQTNERSNDHVENISYDASG